MSLQIAKPQVVYPDSDGQPMADNTLQFKWIVTVKENLDWMYHDAPNVFVAGDLLWYPVQGQPKICQAPDTMAVFGRPKGYRGSYIQHLEEGIAPQVVFEILSPNSRLNELTRKFQFYERYGVEEYYVFDPDKLELFGWLRDGTVLREVPDMEGWVSPRLGVRFSMSSGDLVITRPDGQKFLSFDELAAEREEAVKRAAKAEAEVERLRARLRELDDQN